MPIYFIWIALISIPSVAFSSNQEEGENIFYCRLENNKQVQVKDFGDSLQYRFGRNLQQAELKLEVNKKEARTWQWKGIGRYLYYDLSLFNGKTRYRMFFSVDRLAEDNTLEAGILVEQGDKQLAALKCDPQTLQQALVGLQNVTEEE